MNVNPQPSAGAADLVEGGRPTRRRAATRRRLLEAALDTFAERGFYGSTVEDICDRAGFTRGAFYSNFATKEELFFALYADRMDQFLSRIEEMVSTGAVINEMAARHRAGHGGLEMFTRMIERFLAVQPADRRWYLINTEFTLHAVRHPEAAAALAARRRQVRDRIAELIQRGLAELGRELTIDPDVFMRAVAALHEGGLEQSCLEPEAVPVGDLVRTMLPMLLATLSAQSGPAASPAADDPPAAE